MTTARTVSLAVIGLVLTVQAGLAAPACPPASLHEPLPGATDVTFHDADASTARFPGQWQVGRFGDERQRYRLFQDGSGSVVEDERLRGWHVDFTCDLERKTCRYDNRTGGPKRAVEAARAIGDCLIATLPPPAPPPAESAKPKAPAETKPAPEAKPAPQTKPAPQAKPAPTPQRSPVKPTAERGTPARAKPDATAGSVKAGSGTTKTRHTVTLAASSEKPRPSTAVTAQRTVTVDKPAAQTAVTPAPVTCWADHLPAEPAEARLQRMLLLAGRDSGPVDGLIGPRTRQAFAQVLGGNKPASADPATIRSLRDLLCQTPAAAQPTDETKP